MGVRRKPVPWMYKESGEFKFWTWETEHFIVKISGQGDTVGPGAVLAWQILEKKDGTTFSFENGTSFSLRNAEMQIVEIIAKSWDKKYGYDAYAGDLATTFEIYGGSSLNFAEFIGYPVRLVLQADNMLGSIKDGILGIKNYSILLRTKENKVLVIPPAKIKSVMKVN